MTDIKLTIPVKCQTIHSALNALYNTVVGIALGIGYMGAILFMVTINYLSWILVFDYSSYVNYVNSFSSGPFTPAPYAAGIPIALFVLFLDFIIIIATLRYFDINIEIDCLH